jgi:S-DNA-T family DNA segregation ATPase FtsK/SpoIIIE
MATATAATARTQEQRKADKEAKAKIRQDIISLCSIGLGLFTFFALYFTASGKIGEVLCYFLKGVFGPCAVVLPFFLVLYGLLSLLRKTSYTGARSIILAFSLFLCVGVIWASHYITAQGFPAEPLDQLGLGYIYAQSAAGNAGGIICFFIAYGLTQLIAKVGLIILMSVLFLIFFMLFVNTPISHYLATLSTAKKESKERQKLRKQQREARVIKDAMLKELDDDVDPVSLVADKTENQAPLQIDSPVAASSAIEDQNRKKVIELAANDERFGTRTGTMDKLISKISDITGGRVVDPMKDNMDDQGHVTHAANVATGRNDTKSVDSMKFDNPFDDADFSPELNIASPTGFVHSTRLMGTDHANDNPFDTTPISTDRSNINSNSQIHQEDVNIVNPYEKQLGKLSNKGNQPNSGLRGASDSSNDDAPPFAPDSQLNLSDVAKNLTEKDQALLSYKLPPINLLGKNNSAIKGETNEQLKAKALVLEQSMNDFKVSAKVVKVTVGPTVTRYEVEPDTGVKIGSIKSLEPDLALKLQVKSVRVVPMPGRNVIGIEAYNENASLVVLRDIIDSQEFKAEQSKIAFALGKNISGKPIIADLAEMPHLLIAGTTGSGKSVCINSILLSILYKARPDEVKLILVDPKVVELKSYNDIPHLLLPVVTEPERAASALGYAVSLMNDRYRKFADAGVRNLKGYNEYLVTEDRKDEVLPHIVIVIDELSDLMMVAKGKVEEHISRLAAMARAAGMHLIVATQQPLASILTSVIKANIPSRIAFSVSSNSASRVILDDSGAERLLGNGDMLFAPVGLREPMRLQGSYVSDSEVTKVTEFVKKEMAPIYKDEVIKAVDGGLSADGQATDTPEDEFYDDALVMVIKAGTASVSMIQRRFRIGYNRAARLVDIMEEQGVVAPSDGSNKPREVIWSEKNLDEYFEARGLESPLKYMD